MKRLSMIAAVVLACALAGCGAGGGTYAPAPHAEACRAVTPGERVAIPAGEYVIGGPVRNPEERPERTVTTPGFDIDAHEVTNAQFAAFVEATGYVTIAERQPDPADYPDIDPALLEPGSAVFGVDAGTGILVALRAGCELASPGGAGQRYRGPRGLSGRPCRLCRCARLCRLGWRRSAGRG